MDEILNFYKLIEDTVEVILFIFNKQSKDQIPFRIYQRIEELFMKNIDYYTVDEVISYHEYLVIFIIKF